MRLGALDDMTIDVLTVIDGPSQEMGNFGFNSQYKILPGFNSSPQPKYKETLTTSKVGLLAGKILQTPTSFPIPETSLVPSLKTHAVILAL